MDERRVVVQVGVEFERDVIACISVLKGHTSGQLGITLC
jgi:hypothetical protein